MTLIRGISSAATKDVHIPREFDRATRIPPAEGGQDHAWQVQVTVPLVLHYAMASGLLVDFPHCGTAGKGCSNDKRPPLDASQAVTASVSPEAAQGAWREGTDRKCTVSLSESLSNSTRPLSTLHASMPPDLGNRGYIAAPQFVHPCPLPASLLVTANETRSNSPKWASIEAEKLQTRTVSCRSSWARSRVKKK